LLIWEAVTDLAIESADGLLPMGGSVDRRKARVDHILTGTGMVGDIVI